MSRRKPRPATTPEEVEERRRKCEEIKAKQHARRALGLCRYCDDKPLEGLTSCERHAGSKRKNSKRLAGERKTKGLCTRCNQPRVPGHAFCEKHVQTELMYARRSLPDRKAERDAKRAAGLCPYCTAATPNAFGHAFCQKHVDYFRTVEYKDSRIAYKRGKGRFARARRAAIARVGPQGWGLTQGEYDVIVAHSCEYCTFNNDGTHGGLDRIDNDDPRFYVRDNVVSCCVGCNIARSTRISFMTMKLVVGPALCEGKIRDLEPEAWAMNEEFDDLARDVALCEKESVS